MINIKNSFKNSLHYISKSQNVKNSGWIIGQQIFQMLLQLVVGVLSARYFGPSEYGVLNYTISFVSFFVSITTLGMDSVIIKKIIDSPEDEGIYIGSCIGLRIVASFFSIISVILLVFFLNVDNTSKVLVAALQSVQLSFKAIQILDSWFQRYLKSKYVSVAKMIACVVVSGYKIFLLMAGMNIYWYAMSSLLTDGIIAGIELVFYKRSGGPKLRFSFEYGKMVLKESYHFIISGLMISIYSQMDRIMIGEMLSDYYVGLYTTANTICNMWVVVPSAVISSFQPTIMELKKNGNEKQYMLRLKQLYSFVIWSSILISCLFFAFSKWIVLILYGVDYIESVDTLKISIWYEVFSMIGVARGIWILCEKKSKYVKYMLFIGLIINLVLNYYLIPLIGITGAAIATLVTQITTSILAPLFFKGTRVFTKIVLEALFFKW